MFVKVHSIVNIYVGNYDGLFEQELYLLITYK